MVINERRNTILHFVDNWIMYKFVLNVLIHFKIKLYMVRLSVFA